MVESVTVTVTLLVPTVDGIPVMAPETGSMDSPLGNPVADQEYGVQPPWAARLAEYAAPAVPPGSALVVIDGITATASESVFDAVWCIGVVASVTVIVTLLVPAADGIPVIWPVAGSMLRFAGRPDADHTYGVAPPVALTVVA